MKKIIVISGPPCSGKTVNIQRIQSNHSMLHPFWFNKWAITNKSTFTRADDVELISNNKENQPMVIHYDCMRSFKQGHKVIDESDPFFEYIEKSPFDVVLMVNPIESLSNRINERFNRIKKEISDDRKSKLLKLIDLYSNKDAFLHNYLLWYDFVVTLEPRNIYLYFNGFAEEESYSIATREKFIYCIKQSKIYKDF